MKSSKFFGVTFNTQYSKWIAVLNKKYLGSFISEGEAAKSVDIALIKLGKEPRNILRRIKN